MLAHPVVAAVSDRRRRSGIDATIYVPPYSGTTPTTPSATLRTGCHASASRAQGLLRPRLSEAIFEGIGRQGGSVAFSQVSAPRRGEVRARVIDYQHPIVCIGRREVLGSRIRISPDQHCCAVTGVEPPAIRGAASTRDLAHVHGQGCGVAVRGISNDGLAVGGSRSYRNRCPAAIA